MPAQTRAKITQPNYPDAEVPTENVVMLTPRRRHSNKRAEVISGRTSKRGGSAMQHMAQKEAKRRLAREIVKQQAQSGEVQVWVLKDDTPEAEFTIADDIIPKAQFIFKLSEDDPHACEERQISSGRLFYAHMEVVMANARFRGESFKDTTLLSITINDQKADNMVLDNKQDWYNLLKRLRQLQPSEPKVVVIPLFGQETGV